MNKLSRAARETGRRRQREHLENYIVQKIEEEERNVI